MAKDISTTTLNPDDAPTDDVIEAGSHLPVPTVSSMMDGPTAEDVEDMAVDTAVTGTPTYSDTPDFSSADVKWPMLRVAQPMTQEVTSDKAKIGDFVLGGFPPKKTVTVVPLRWAKTRIYGVGSGNDRKVLCQSSNGKMGSGLPGGKTEVGVYACMDDAGNPLCEMAKWTPNPANPGKNSPPKCQEIQNYICYVLEFKSVVLLSLKSTATKTAQGINSLIITRGMKNFAVVLHTVKQSGSQGVFFVPMYTIIEEDDMPVFEQKDGSKLTLLDVAKRQFGA